MNTVISILVILFLAAALIGILVALVLAIRGDGYGDRPGPRSHDNDRVPPGLSFR